MGVFTESINILAGEFQSKLYELVFVSPRSNRTEPGDRHKKVVIICKSS